MTLIQSDDKIKNIPTRAKEVYDVTGASSSVDLKYFKQILKYTKIIDEVTK